MMNLVVQVGETGCRKWCDMPMTRDGSCGCGIEKLWSATALPKELLRRAVASHH
ncbi:hypothetical protein ES702_07135 [subsurface metagenome]